MPTWRKVVLKAAGFGAGLGLSLCVFVTVWGWYSSRPKPAKPWDAKAISAEYDGVTTESDTNVGTTFVVYYTLQNNTDFDYQVNEQGEQVLLAGQLERENSASIDNENLKGQFPLFIPARGRVRFAIHLKYPYSGGAEPTEGIDAIHAYRAKVANFMATEFNNLNGFTLYDQKHRYQILFPKGWKKSEQPTGEATHKRRTAMVEGVISRFRGKVEGNKPWENYAFQEMCNDPTVKQLDKDEREEVFKAVGRNGLDCFWKGDSGQQHGTQ